MVLLGKIPGWIKKAMLIFIKTTTELFMLEKEVKIILIKFLILKKNQEKNTMTGLKYPYSKKNDATLSFAKFWKRIQKSQ